VVMIVPGFILSEASATMQKHVPLLGNLERLQQQPIGRRQIRKAKEHKEREAARLREFLDKNKETGKRLLEIAVQIRDDIEDGGTVPEELRRAFTAKGEQLSPKVGLSSRARLWVEKPGLEWLIGDDGQGNAGATTWYRLAREEDKLVVYAARGPIHPGVFPGDSGTDKYAASNFQDRYRKEQARLLEVLDAEEVPTDKELADYARRLEEQRKRREEESSAGSGESRLGDRGSLELRGNLRHGSSALSGPRGSQQDDAREARIRYCTNRAHELHCYAGPESLDPRPEITKSIRPPGVEEMWYGQVALWIQEDVIGALAGLNEKVVNQRRDDNGQENEKSWVGNLPVKDLVAFTVFDYVVAGDPGSPTVVPAQGRSGMGRDQGRQHSSSADSAFTGRGCDGNVAVVHFEVELAIEATYLLRVIDAISEAGFYTPLEVSYWREPPVDPSLASGQRREGEQDKYIYGPAPTIWVRLLYEGCFFRSSYERWMPQTVKTAIEEGRAAGAGRPRPAAGHDALGDWVGHDKRSPEGW